MISTTTCFHFSRKKGAKATIKVSASMSSKKALIRPAPSPSIQTRPTALNKRQNAPVHLASRGCACSHFSMLPVVDNLAFPDVLYQKKVPIKPSIKKQVFMQCDIRYKQIKVLVGNKSLAGVSPANDLQLPVRNMAPAP